MKYLKKFENLKQDIKVGDYVALKQISQFSDLYKYFLEVPCEVIAYVISDADNYGVKLRYRDKELWCSLKDIEKVSKSKEEIEIYLQAKKYNL